MHFPETQPRNSLYYPYQVYPYFHSPQKTVAQTGTVTIVGAGPIGMATALLLARQGIRVVLLSAEQQLSEGSRALVYTVRSMEILQSAGVAQRIMQKLYRGHMATLFIKDRLSFAWLHHLTHMISSRH